MGFFSKTLQAAMPKMIGNPITTAVAMVSVALSVVKGKKATKATKNKKKATVKKSKIVSKKQKKQMEVMERVCQSAYGIYIRGVTTVAARYIGHPAVAIPASEMVKTMMEEAAPSVNKYCVICTEQKQKIDTNDIVQIAQIYKNAINETKQYLKDKKLYIPTVNDYLLTGYNGTIQSVQYLMDKYCPELGETLDNIKEKKAEMISSFYENNRQIYIKNPEKGSIFDKMLFDVPIDETNMNIFRKAGVAVNGVVSGFLKDVASGANAIVDVALSPLDVAEAMTSPGALTLGTILNGMTEDVVNDWQKGTIQGKTEAIGRVISIISPTEILKAAGVVRKGVKAVGGLGKTANVVDTAVDATKNLANAADTAVDLTKSLSNLGDMTEDAARGLNGLTSKLKNIKEKFTDDIISQKPKELLEQKPNGIPEQKPKELLEQKPNGTPEQKPKELLEQKPNETPEQKPNEAPEQKPNGTPEQKPNEVPEQKPNEAPEQKSEELLEQKPNEAPAETVVRGKSDVNGSSSVNINGKRPNHNMDNIKTPETQVKGFISDADRMKLNSWKNKISDELYLKHKNVFDNPKYYDQKTGWPIWPGQNGDPNIDGFLNGKYTNEMLQPGQTLDRYGKNNGTFFGDVGTPISHRAMAPDSDFSLYNQYKVTKELPVRKGEIAPWFDEPGGGIQYMLDPDFVKKIKEIQNAMQPQKDFIDILIEMGYLDRL